MHHAAVERRYDWTALEVGGTAAAAVVLPFGLAEDDALGYVDIVVLVADEVDTVESPKGRYLYDVCTMRGVVAMRMK